MGERITDPRQLARNREAMMAKIDADIERVGWSLISVFPTEDSGTDWYSYTIGLQVVPLNHPELIIATLAQEQAHSVLYSAIEEIKAGVRFEPGQNYDKVLAAPLQVRFRVVPPPRRPLNVARAYYRERYNRHDFEALQLVWPDAEGRFPGDEGFDEKFAQAFFDGDGD